MRRSAYQGRPIGAILTSWTALTIYRPMVNSSRFGEPLPGLLMAPAVAFAVNALATVAGLAVG